MVDGGMWRWERFLGAGALALGLAALAAPAATQHATAPDGYYPASYAGDMFTGVVASADMKTSQVALLYTEGKKVERFVGVVAQPFTARGNDGAVYEVTPAIFRRGMEVTVYYIQLEQGQAGAQTKVNEIFLIKVGKTAILNSRYKDLLYQSF